MSRIAAIRAAAKGVSTPVDDDENDEETCENDGATAPSKSKRKDSDMAEAENNAAAIEAAKKDGHAQGFKAANERMNAVFASEHYAGREATAAKLLGKEAMSADDIIEVLADMPKVEQAALTEEQQRAAAEEAGRKEMREQIGQQGNSNVDADTGGKATEPNHGWDAIHADIRARRG
jgi:hypothetical protein